MFKITLIAAACASALLAQNATPNASMIRFDVNQRKLEAADALAGLAEDAGMTLIHLAIAFAIHHPAVTAAIIGPRTMEHLESQLGAVDVELDAQTLDRIDQIVAPGTNLNPADRGWTPPALADASLRRRA